MADLADHIASWGLVVVRPDLCHGGPLGVDHPENGRDLAALGDAISDGRPVYFVGHSAGGLAALLAASQSSVAAGHLGLDTVDASNLGLNAAGTLTVPVAALVGMPELCNSNGNAADVYAEAAGASVLRLPGADHCDFESPTDVLCTALCANGSGAEPFTPELVIAMTTAWLTWQTGLEPGGEAWWDGVGLDSLVTAGAIEVVQ
jgi:dienelactone hydrolase